MALIGNCSHTTYADHETETQTTTITQPDGTSTNQEVPVVVASQTDYTDVYLCITQIDNFTRWYASENENEATEKDRAFLVHYSAYASQRARDLDQDNALFTEIYTLQNYNDTESLYSQAYTQIKQIEGLTNLTDA